MKMPSRFMPLTIERKIEPIGYLLLTIFIVWMAWFLWQFYNKPLFWLIISAVILFGWIMLVRWKRQMQTLSDERKDESICNFARSFNCKEMDTWIIRATYEEVQKYLSRDIFVPLRASDHLTDDLHIDEEDLEDIGSAIAARAGYDMKDTKGNPLYGKVKTIKDLVLFFTHQQKIRA